MVKRNENFGKLHAGYLFPEIARRRRKFQEENPNAKIISLGIGNTTIPLSKHITDGLIAESKALGNLMFYLPYYCLL